MQKILTIINRILIVVAVIGSYYFVLARDREIGLILKDASIIITITFPYILERLLHKEISIVTKFIYIAFVFVAQFLGATVELYNHLSYFDKITHFASGMVAALFALPLLVAMKVYDKNKVGFNILFMILVSLSVAGSWELFEYGSNLLFGTDPQRVALTGINDTMLDMLAALAGTGIICFWYRFTKKKEVIEALANSIKLG